jgi:hypothetical protein
MTPYPSLAQITLRPKVPKRFQRRDRQDAIGAFKQGANKNDWVASCPQQADHRNWPWLIGTEPQGLDKYHWGDIAINGHTVDAIGGETLRGRLLLTTISGRLPRQANEVALGASTMRQAGAQHGSTVQVSAPSPTGETCSALPHFRGHRSTGRGARRGGDREAGLAKRSPPISEWCLYPSLTGGRWELWRSASWQWWVCSPSGRRYWRHVPIRRTGCGLSSSAARFHCLTVVR